MNISGKQEKVISFLQVLNRLGKGAQGSVFLVQDKVTGQKRVLKKVKWSC